MPALLALLLLVVLVAPASAAAAPLDVLPQTPEHCAVDGAGPAAPVARAAASGPSVRRVIRDAVAKDALTAEDGERFEALHEAALDARGRLGGGRRAEMAGVIRGLEELANRRLLTVSRMPVLLRQLEVNTAWWSANDPPAPPPPPEGGRPCAGGAGQGGARVIRDELVFQWYAGQGLQIQQLATAGRANALVLACVEPNPKLACDRARVRTAMDGLVAMSSDRGGFRAWEYFFAFGGGRPPWASGLAQGTAMQALARGSQVLQDPRYLDAAREGVGLFARRAPRGVRVPAGDGAHFLIYSFNPRLRVLNGFLQSLVGLHDYAQIAQDAEARALFEEGERRARQEVPGADTGAWSRYSAGGAESDLGYHRLVRDFLRSMCERTARRAVYCATADRFTAYLRERAGLKLLPAPRPRVRRAAQTRFYLTKISCVTLTVTRGGRPVATVSKVLGRGAQALGWVPAKGGEHEVRIEARDLVGHRTRLETPVRVSR